MDGVSSPFTTQATMTRGGPLPEPIPNPLTPGWVRIPVTVQIRLSEEVAEYFLHSGPAPDPDDEAGFAMLANSMRLDFARAQTGDLNPQDQQWVG